MREPRATTPKHSCTTHERQGIWSLRKKRRLQKKGGILVPLLTEEAPKNFKGIAFLLKTGEFKGEFEAKKEKEKIEGNMEKEDFSLMTRRRFLLKRGTAPEWPSS